jgi:hypothetical protein
MRPSVDQEHEVFHIDGFDCFNRGFFTAGHFWQRDDDFVHLSTMGHIEPKAGIQTGYTRGG